MSETWHRDGTDTPTPFELRGSSTVRNTQTMVFVVDDPEEPIKIQLHSTSHYLSREKARTLYAELRRVLGATGTALPSMECDSGPQRGPDTETMLAVAECAERAAEGLAKAPDGPLQFALRSASLALSRLSAEIASEGQRLLETKP